MNHFTIYHLFSVTFTVGAVEKLNHWMTHTVHNEREACDEYGGHATYITTETYMFSVV